MFITNKIVAEKYQEIDIINEEWDNLIILDACRYDTFKELYNKDKLKGKLEKRFSQGSNTNEWLQKNFNYKKHLDITYITANPQVNMSSGDFLPYLYNVWQTGWDQEQQTILPKTMYETTKTILEKENNKERLIIHFIQPHSPYPNGTGFAKMLKNDIIRLVKIHADTDLWYQYPQLTEENLFYDKMKEGYEQNLASVLPYVYKLAKELKGKTIISADHGEAFGERLNDNSLLKIYGHQDNINHNVLRLVPWFICK